jgi:beta-lactamase regulating signal transducer with metallopeptidase domain
MEFDVTIELLLFSVGCALRASIILGFAWGVTALLSRASASTRHFVWACAIVGAALVPATMKMLPQWRLSLPPAFARLASLAPASARVAVSGPKDASETGATQRPTSLDRRVLRARPTLAVPSNRISYAAIAGTVWVAGTTAVLLYIVVGFFAAWRLRRAARPVATAAVSQAHALARRLEITGPIGVVESANVCVPGVCGLWHPTIVLPKGAQLWPEQRLRNVIMHELAHVKRRDSLTQAVGHLICAAYWFNPLAWIAARRLRAERERACDDFVLATGTKASVYARQLVEIAFAMQPGRLPNPVGLEMAHRSELEDRLRAILDSKIQRSTGRYTRLALVATVLLISIPVTAFRLESSAVARRQATVVSNVTPHLPVSLKSHARDFRWNGRLDQGKILEVRVGHGTIRTIRSADGLIHVDARIKDPGRVRVDIVRRAPGISICTVVSTPQGDESECQPGHGPKQAQTVNSRVDFVVHIPAGIRFTGSIDHGDIALDNPASAVNAATLDGNITVSLADGQSADFHANVINGTIEADFPVYDDTPSLPWGDRPNASHSPRIVHATVGNGGPALLVSTIDGNIQLRRR